MLIFECLELLSGTGELHSHSTRLVRQKEVARTKSLAFHDLTPKDIAEQLTHIDCRSLKKIPVRPQSVLFFCMWPVKVADNNINKQQKFTLTIVKFEFAASFISVLCCRCLNGKRTQERQS